MYVTSESNYYTLVDDTNTDNSSGWEADTAGGGTWGSITGTLSDQTDLQSALDGKQATITGGATTITDTDLTASRALTSDVSGKVAVSAVTADELDHVSGVTSPIQTQIDNKIAKYTTEYPGGSNKNIFSLVALSQAEYDALTPDADTIYFII